MSDDGPACSKHPWMSCTDDQLDALWRVLTTLGAGGLSAGHEANTLIDEVEAERARRCDVATSQDA